MIDINKIVSDAIESEVNKVVARILLGPGLQETVNSFIQTYLEDHPPQTPNLGQLRAQFAEDINQLNIRIDRVNGRVDDWGLVLQGIKETLSALKDEGGDRFDNIDKRFTRIEETLSGMQERFALKDVVDTGYSALVQQVAQLDEDIQSAHRQINTLERDSRSNELDSDELATTIADLFSDGTLTITIDKV